MSSPASKKPKLVSNESSHLCQGIVGRTNEEWISCLQCNDSNALGIQAELRDYIRRGLGRAFGNQGGIDETLLEDFTQDSMILLTTKLEDFRGESKFTTWAMSIAIHVGYSTLRRRRWGERSLEDLGVSVDSQMSSHYQHSVDPTHQTSRGDLLSTLQASIEQDLSPRQRAAILGELAGMPSAVLAEQLETNPNALYKLHHDARLRLKAALEKRGFSKTDVRKILNGASQD